MATKTNHDIRFESAIEELRKTPIWRSNYLPPITRLLRALGFAVRPPHYYSFASNMLSCAAWFSTFWGLSRRMHDLSTWDSLPVPAPGPIIDSRQR